MRMKGWLSGWMEWTGAVTIRSVLFPFFFSTAEISGWVFYRAGFGEPSLLWVGSFRMLVVFDLYMAGMGFGWLCLESKGDSRFFMVQVEIHANGLNHFASFDFRPHISLFSAKR